MVPARPAPGHGQTHCEARTFVPSRRGPELVAGVHERTYVRSAEPSRTSDPGTGREPASVDAMLSPSAPALNREQALELLEQLEAALDEIRRLRSIRT